MADTVQEFEWDKEITKIRNAGEQYFTNKRIIIDFRQITEGKLLQ